MISNRLSAFQSSYEGYIIGAICGAKETFFFKEEDIFFGCSLHSFNRIRTSKHVLNPSEKPGRINTS